MSLKEFKVCKKCDFEWHVKDGSCCPICESSEELAEEKGGVFGTGKDASIEYDEDGGGTVSDSEKETLHYLRLVR